MFIEFSTVLSYLLFFRTCQVQFHGCVKKQHMLFPLLRMLLSLVHTMHYISGKMPIILVSAKIEREKNEIVRYIFTHFWPFFNILLTGSKNQLWNYEFWAIIIIKLYICWFLFVIVKKKFRNLLLDPVNKIGLRNSTFSSC